MWVHLPSRLCPSVPESGGSNWESGSFFQGCASLLTSRGMFRQPKHWRDAWTTGRLTPLRFGPTLPVSTVEDGLDRWISSWAEFRANRSAWPASARGRQTSDGSGPTSGAGFGTFDRDSSSWRTFPDLFGMDYPLSLETWPKRGSLRSGVVSARRMSERPIVESGYSSWPTATVHGNHNRKGLSPTSGDGLATAVAQWPTPRAEDSESTGAHRDTPDTLTSATRQWPTPTANDSKNDNPPSQAERNTPPRSVAAANWQTPRAIYGAGHAGMEDESHLIGQAIQWQTPTVGGGGQQCDLIPHRGHFLRPSGKKATLYLEQQAAQWATPHANMTTGPGGNREGGPNIQTQADSFHRDRQTGRGGPRTPAPVVLNPRFVEALMGLPDGMTDSTPLEMRSFRSWLATHSQRLRVLLDSTSMVRRAA